MKQVTLLGDSIRVGYQETVKQELAGVAEVWAPEGNGMHSVHHLCNLAWYMDHPADVIHFNFGLWDCRRITRGHSENLVPRDVFARNLDFLLGTVTSKTSATLIWATITPIVQATYDARFLHPWQPYRMLSDIAQYNEAASPILAKYGVQTNDLNALVTREGPETLISEDGVHYTPEGSARLSRQVAEVIRKAL